MPDFFVFSLKIKAMQQVLSIALSWHNDCGIRFRHSQRVDRLCCLTMDSPSATRMNEPFYHYAGIPLMLRNSL